MGCPRSLHLAIKYGLLQHTRFCELGIRKEKEGMRRQCLVQFLPKGTGWPSHNDALYGPELSPYNWELEFVLAASGSSQEIVFSMLRKKINVVLLL